MDWLGRLLRVIRRPTTTGHPAIKLVGTEEHHTFLRGYSDAASFSSVEVAVQRKFKLFRHSGTNSKRDFELGQLKGNPELAALFLFHGDGFIREAALNVLPSPINLPVVAYGLLRRMNDWSPEVRSAASNAFTRCFGSSDPSVLLPAVWVVLRDAKSWARWQDGYPSFINEIMRQPKLTRLLVMRLLSETRCGARAVFEAMCRSPEMDKFFMQIAARAYQPNLRACALNFIATGKVVWPIGRTQKVWVDKSLGKYKVIQDYGSRPLSFYPDLAPILRAALSDRSVMVRKEALDVVTLHRDDPHFCNIITECLQIFSNDQRPSIRLRLDFLKRNVPKFP